MLFNGRDKKSEFVIFDAKDIAKGPINRYPIQSTNVPIGLHGYFADGLVFDPTDLNRRFKVRDN